MKRLLLPSRWALLGTVLVVLVAPAAIGADEEHEFDALRNSFWEQFSAARYGEAEKTARQMIDLGKSHGEDEPELVTMGYAALGSLHNVCGRTAEAETVFTEVAGIWKRARGETDGWYGNALADLADVYHRQGRHQESQRLYQQALGIMRTAWGDEDEDVVRVGTNLADVDMAIGDYSSSESLYRKALEVFESTYGRDAPS